MIKSYHLFYGGKELCSCGSLAKAMRLFKGYKNAKVTEAVTNPCERGSTLLLLEMKTADESNERSACVILDEYDVRRLKSRLIAAEASKKLFSKN